MTLYTIGYGRWTTATRLEQLLSALRQADVGILIDIRSPCPSALSPQSIYGPRGWHLLNAGEGLDGHLRTVGIDYLWLVELGNPQKNCPNMTILRAHLAAPDQPWPVNRGLKVLHGLVTSGKACALLCACKDYSGCHRKLIAEAYRARYFPQGLTLHDLP